MVIKELETKMCNFLPFRVVLGTESLDFQKFLFTWVSVINLKVQHTYIMTKIKSYELVEILIKMCSLVVNIVLIILKKITHYCKDCKPIH